jgi:hypothetical protein
MRRNSVDMNLISYHDNPVRTTNRVVFAARFHHECRLIVVEYITRFVCFVIVDTDTFRWTLTLPIDTFAGAPDFGLVGERHHWIVVDRADVIAEDGLERREVSHQGRVGVDNVVTL